MKYILLTFLFLSFFFFGHGQENALLLFQKNEIEVSKNNVLTKKYYFEVLINNRFGEEFTKISIPYSRKNKIRNLQAHIKDNKGNIVRTLKKNEIIDRSYISEISLYEDNMVKEFIMNHNEYPFSICYSYTQEEKEFLYIDYWIPVLAQHIPTVNAELQLSVPINYPISISQNHIDDPQITETENYKTYVWKTTYATPIPKEVLAPPVQHFMPLVKITPHEFKYDKVGSLQDWKAFGNWECDLLKGLNNLPQSEKAKTDWLVRNTTDKKEIIKILYHHLQDATRYINVSIDKGGLKPYPASYVATNKYGDCKALTNYMKTLLENYGISSHYTNIQAGESIKEINLKFPSQQFNHVILMVPLEEDTIWLDSTSKGPFNYLGTFNQNRDVFVIEQDNSHFIKTPALTVTDVKSSRNITVEFMENGTGKVTSKNVYRGKMFEIMSQIDKMMSKNDQKSFIQDYISGSKNELVSYEIVKADRDDTHIQANFVTHCPNIYKTYGNDIILTNIDDMPLPNLENPEKRILPLQINYPLYQTDTITYILPEKFILDIKPQNQHIETKFGNYNINYVFNDETIKIERAFLLKSGNYPIEEYNEFFNFIENIKKAQNSSIITLNKN